MIIIYLYDLYSVTPLRIICFHVLSNVQFAFSVAYENSYCIFVMIMNFPLIFNHSLIVS